MNKIISELIKDVKIKNLNYNIFRNVFDDVYTLNDFQNTQWGKHIERKNKKKYYRNFIEKEDEKYFDKNVQNFIKDLNLIDHGFIKNQFENPKKEDYFVSFMLTDEKEKNKIWATLHGDDYDVFWWSVCGSVEWMLEDFDGNKSFEILNPGDVLYLKAGIKHQTRPLSARLSFIYMPYKDPRAIHY